MRRPLAQARRKSSLPAFSRKNSVPGGISCQRGPQIRFSHPSSAASAAVRDSKVLCHVHQHDQRHQQVDLGKDILGLGQGVLGQTVQPHLLGLEGDLSLIHIYDRFTLISALPRVLHYGDTLLFGHT